MHSDTHPAQSGRMLILSQADVETLLDLPGCETAMVTALTGFARGSHCQPPRVQVRLPDVPVLMGLMPAFRAGGNPVWGLKDVVVAPGNPARGLDSHQGAVLLHDGQDGRLLAVVDATAITAIRTAAVSAVATRALARANTEAVAILGTGVQARWHIAAMRLVFPAARIVLWGRDTARAAALAEQTGVLACATVAEATRGAGVICTVTAATAPILDAGLVPAGCHVNAVGACSPRAREVAGDLVREATVVVDSRAQAAVECGELLLAMQEGAIGADHVAAELGEVLLGRHPGRQDAREITLFKSLGLAVEDLEAALLVVARARARGIGTEVAW